jgi:hypothetical protein
MADAPMNLQVTEQARMAYSSLGPDDRRLVDAWFDHLRNWRNDEFVRSRSRRLRADEDLYAFQTSSDDIMIGFRINDSEITVLSIFRREWLRAFEAEVARSTA